MYLVRGECRFISEADREVSLVCSANYRGTGCLLKWRRNGKTGTYAASGRSRALRSAITALDATSVPPVAAAGTADGELFVFSADTLRPVVSDKKAHMVFATAAAVAADGTAVVTTSADASARVTPLPLPRTSGSGWGTLLVLLLLLAAVVFAVLKELDMSVEEAIAEVKAAVEALLPAPADAAPDKAPHVGHDEHTEL